MVRYWGKVAAGNNGVATKGQRNQSGATGSSPPPGPDPCAAVCEIDSRALHATW